MRICVKFIVTRQWLALPSHWASLWDLWWEPTLPSAPKKQEMSSTKLQPCLPWPSVSLICSLFGLCCQRRWQRTSRLVYRSTLVWHTESLTCEKHSCCRSIKLFLRKVQIPHCVITSDEVNITPLQKIYLKVQYTNRIQVMQIMQIKLLRYWAVV